jgi:hypothetical protein
VQTTVESENRFCQRRSFVEASEKEPIFVSTAAFVEQPNEICASNATAEFIACLNDDPRFAEPRSLVKNLADALTALEHEATENADAAAIFAAIEWIIGQPDGLEKRLQSISRLLALGRVENLSMRQFYGLQ